MNKKSNRPTLKDIATEAGVSISTVSRILSDNGYPVSDESKFAVLAAVEKVGYNIDHYKANSRDKNKIALIIPNILNPYYPRLISGVSRACSKHQIELVLFNSENDPYLEKQILNNIHIYEYSGIIVVSICSNHSHIDRLLAQKMHIVVCEQPLDIDCCQITFNYFDGGLLATNYLIEKGKKKIAYISSPLSRPSRISLFNGYKKALERSGIGFDEKLVRIAKSETRIDKNVYEFENGKEQVRSLLESPIMPDSVFCVNDLTAMGAMVELQNNHIRIPEDIGVMGFDNIVFSELTNPPLTTIDQSGYELGNMAVEMLVGKMNDSRRKDASVVLEPTIIIRGSV